MKLTPNVQNAGNILSQCPEDLNVIVFAVKGRNNSGSIFKTRREKKMMRMFGLNKIIHYVKNNYRSIKSQLITCKWIYKCKSKTHK